MAGEKLDRMSSSDQKMIETQEAMEAIEEMRQQEDDLKNEMIANNDNGDPPRVWVLNGWYNKSESKTINVNGTESKRDGANSSNTYLQLWKSFESSLFGIELWLQASHKKLDYNYIKDQSTTMKGRGWGGYIKAYLWTWWEHCYSCDVWNNSMGIRAFAELGIQKIITNGETVCDCTGDILHAEKLTLTESSLKLGVELVLQNGIKLQGYRQKTDTWYKFRNDDFKVYMNGRGVGASIPLH